MGEFIEVRRRESYPRTGDAGHTPADADFATLGSTKTLAEALQTAGVRIVNEVIVKGLLLSDRKLGVHSSK